MTDWIKRYDVRAKSEWAVVVVDSKGFLGIVSTYGNYAFHWTSFGEDFKAFLLKINEGYLVGKLTLGRPEEYDPRKTLKFVETHILENRRNRNYSKEKARKEWDLLEVWDDLEHEDDFKSWMGQTSIDDAYEFHCSVPCSQATMFADLLWPKFKEALQADPPCVQP
jgi:hypothetical protein